MKVFVVTEVKSINHGTCSSSCLGVFGTKKEAEDVIDLCASTYINTWKEVCKTMFVERKENSFTFTATRYKKDENNTYAISFTLTLDEVEADIY